MMICGNKQTLGRAVLDGLESGETQILSEHELNEIKENGHLMVELWNE